MAVAGSRVVIAGRVASVEETACHFTHALAKLGQKLQRAFILRRLLLRVAVARLLRRVVGGRWLVVLLRITTLRLLVIALRCLR